MRKVVTALVALLLVAGIVAGVKARSDGGVSENKPTQQVSAPQSPTVTTVEARTSQSSPVASPIGSPTASPIAGKDCTGIGDWFTRVQTRVAPLDELAAQFQTQEELVGASLDQITAYLDLLKSVRAEQAADVPASSGAVMQSALMMLFDREIDQFEAVVVAINSDGDVGAVYAAHLASVTEATQALSATAIAVGFACIDEF
jgi:hypothetical protein